MGTWSTDGPWFVRVSVFYCGKRAADHGVVRDFAAAFILINRLDARDGFDSGGANVVDHSVVQRSLPPKMRPPWELGRPMDLGLSGLASSTAATRQRTTEWSATFPQRSFRSSGLTLATGSKAEAPMSWTTPWSNAATLTHTRVVSAAPCRCRSTAAVSAIGDVDYDTFPCRRLEPT
jgi:hypothetical protein